MKFRLLYNCWICKTILITRCCIFNVVLQIFFTPVVNAWQTLHTVGKNMQNIFKSNYYYTKKVIGRVQNILNGVSQYLKIRACTSSTLACDFIVTTLQQLLLTAQAVYTTTKDFWLLCICTIALRYFLLLHRLHRTCTAFMIFIHSPRWPSW